MNSSDFKETPPFLTYTFLILVPRFQGSEVQQDWVGLRPARSKVRLEKETIICENNKLLRVGGARGRVVKAFDPRFRLMGLDSRNASRV